MKKNNEPSRIRIVRKLRNRAGETLTETLVALLVGTMSLAMLASMIGTTSKIIRETEGVLEGYYTSCAQLASHTKDSEDSSVTTTSGQVQINSASFYLSGDTNSTPATYYSTVSAGHTITTYERGAE